MARYVSLVRFTEQGARAIKQSTRRAQAFRKAAAKAGVKVEAQYWTVGAYDGVMILSADQEAKVLQLLTSLATAGNVRTESLRALDEAEFTALVGK
ncbi:MAG: GYD domain-containing protein [Chloroflexi bacterium]|nr:GYD domain-containing protein [Chloroflexota bacterium]